jgi:hypothetical protein
LRAEKEARRAENQKRLAELQAENEARKAKLAQAGDLIKEALRP